MGLFLSRDLRVRKKCLIHKFFSSHIVKAWAAEVASFAPAASASMHFCITRSCCLFVQLEAPKVFFQLTKGSSHTDDCMFLECIHLCKEFHQVIQLVVCQIMGSSLQPSCDTLWSGIRVRSCLFVGVVLNWASLGCLGLGS